ncbi:MAG: hypothetical protein ACK55I_03165, partial [bacterium]
EHSTFAGLAAVLVKNGVLDVIADHRTRFEHAKQLPSHVGVMFQKLIMRSTVAHVALRIAVDVERAEWRAEHGSVNALVRQAGQQLDAISVVDSPI